jgi:hypothetical protein
MPPAIEFNHQPTFNTTKVSDEGTDRVLSTKLCIVELSVAQPRPEFAFRIGLLAPQASGIYLLFSRVGLHHNEPSP